MESIHVLARADATEVILWVGLFVAAIFLGTLLLTIARRRLLGSDSTPGEGMMLSDLRKMHTEGSLSDEEFEAARAAIVGTARPTQPHAHVHELKTRREAQNNPQRESNGTDQ